MTPRPRSDLVDLAGYHSPQVHCDARLNTNESPYGPPRQFIEELTSAVADMELHRYPDRNATNLRQGISAYAGVEPEGVFAANGSNEVIQTLFLAFGGPERRALVFTPTYTLHSHIAGITGTPVRSEQRDADFVANPALVEDALRKHDPDVVLFCHPNNPTGQPEIHESVLCACAGGDRLVIVDEAYGEFMDDSMQPHLADWQNLVVVRTLSKAWALSGARVGYVIAHSDLVSLLEAVHLPYHLSVLTQAAGKIALGYEQSMRERIELIVAERERVYSALAGLDGIKVWPSAANFLLIRPDADADTVWRELLDRGVLIRNFAARPDTPGCLRVTVGTAEDNDVFLSALDHVLSHLK